MSTYLLALYIGEVECVSAKSRSGCEVRVWTPIGEKDLGVLPLNEAVQFLDYYEDFYCIPYVLPKLDLVGLDTFIFGGMENWGLIFFSSSSLYVPESALFSKKCRLSTIVAHEIAHMWFGNLVTMEWWNDLWLNEGFATYASWMAIKHVHKDRDVDSMLFEDDVVSGLKTDAFPSTHAVSIDAGIDDPIVIGNMCDKHLPTRKGMAVLRMASIFCGERQFAKGVSHVF